MRIVSGKHKGRKLFEPKGGDIRPTSSVVKEGIFDVIQFGVGDSDFLDLFAGTGAMGIEALSRGARVVFNDSSPQSITLIKKNLELIKENADVMRGDAMSTIARLSAKGKKFDYIFLDPPYAIEGVSKLLNAIINANILKDNGMLIYEHSLKTEVPDVGFRVVKEKRYGQIMVAYMQKQRSRCAVTGSFDPITSGHIDVIKRAREQFDEVFVVMLKNQQRQYTFSEKIRCSLIKKALLAENIDAAFYADDGLAVDFCKRNNINIIVRGIRNQQDAVYEKEMAAYNSRGGVETLFLAANFPVSATLVRQRLENGESLEGLVPQAIIADVQNAYDKLLKDKNKEE